MSLAMKSAMMGACLAAVVTAAYAADMPGNLPLPAVIRPNSPTALSSWYLRGDFAYRWGIVRGADPAPGFAEPANGKLGTAYGGGLGVGVKSDWLRVDLTVDGTSKAKYESTTVTTNDTTAKVSAVTAMFNGYLDLATWYGVTPYVGGGFGGARLQITDYQSTVAPPFGGDTSRSQWNFAWAAMGGLAYQIAPNMQVDVGYRYLNLGDITTGTGTSGALTLKGIANHEVRVGLRWNFDDLN
jgi:opacity protein-like surface antigen